MSHIAVVNCQIKAEHLERLAEAVEKLGGELKLGQTSFKMYGAQKQPCIHAIAIKGDASDYEVGLRYKSATDQETFDMACDFYDGHLTKAFGQNLVGLQNEYTALVAEKQLRKNGYRVRRDTEAPAHQIRLVAVA